MGSDSPFGEPFYGEESKNVVEMDNCVSCGKETKYPKHTHIDFRKNYVEGAGQLCDECANKIYNKN